MSYEWKDGGAGTIVAGGTELECASWGPAPGSAPTLVLLHEGLGCVAMWRDFPAKLVEATGFGVFAYSRAGYGRSGPAALPRPNDYMTREAVDVLPEVLDRAGFRRGVLMGHSDGATISAVYAGSIPDMRVRGLCLMAPHFFVEGTTLASIAAAKKDFESGDLRDKLAGFHDDADAAVRGWCDAWLDPDFKNWDVGDAIDHWRVPTLAIQGRQDPYGTLAQIEEIESRAYSPAETLVLDGCGHSPHIERPDDVIEGVGDFAGRLERLEREVVKVA